MTDPNHSVAVEFLKLARDLALPALTTLTTIYETHRRLLYGFGRFKATLFLDKVFDGSVSIIRTEPLDEARARDLIARYAAVNFTLADAVILAVMERLAVACVFSFDDDFFVAGVLRVPPFPQ